MEITGIDRPKSPLFFQNYHNPLTALLPLLGMLGPAQTARATGVRFTKSRTTRPNKKKVTLRSKRKAAKLARKRNRK